MAINPFMLNKRIEVGTTNPVKNKNTGGYLPHFASLFTVWAGIKTRSIPQQYTIYGTDLQDTIILIVRHNPKIVAGQKIRMAGTIYEIVLKSPDETFNLNPYDLLTIQEVNKKAGA